MTSLSRGFRTERDFSSFAICMATGGDAEAKIGGSGRVRPVVLQWKGDTGFQCNAREIRVRLWNVRRMLGRQSRAAWASRTITVERRVQ